MILTLVDRYITYPYGVLEDVIIIVDDLFFPIYFVILDMPEDAKIPLILGSPFLATGRSLVDVKQGELILRFNKGTVLFNVFEVMRHHKENP